MIGIAITTYNRNEALEETLRYIKKYLPKNAILEIVDDGSEVVHPEATFAFPENVGTPIAKNKCLELLYDKGCEHIFLFDSDCYPIVKGWEKPYIDSIEPHLNFTFKYPFEIKNNHKVLQNPNGCMMYINRCVLDNVGGFDTGFKYYGYWHGAFSNRVFNKELTSAPFIDVIDSEKLFCSMDEKGTIKSSREDRGMYLSSNKKRYYETLKSKQYHSFRSNSVSPKIHYSNPYSTAKNIGKALNEFCALVPDDDWICLQDGDMMYLTPDWGVQIQEVVNRYGNEFSLIGCLTNRLARNIQVYDWKNYDNHNIEYHYKISERLSKEHFAEVEDITRKKYVAGLFMLFPKSLWNKVKFAENDAGFDDTFSKAVTDNGGKLGLMKGLYVYHSYRIWSKNPRRDRGHLFL